MKDEITIALLMLVTIGSTSLAQGQSTFSFKDTPGEYLDILCDNKPIVRYMYACDRSTKESRFATSKPFYNVFDPEGKEFITNSFDPNALYPHHRGIFIGWNKLQYAGGTYDLWHMGKGESQQHIKFLNKVTESEKATLQSLINWKLPDDQTIIEEKRQITIYKEQKPTILLADFDIELKAVNGDVLLDGDPEHGGFQYRPHNDVAKGSERTKNAVTQDYEKVKAAYLFHADGIDPTKDYDLPWVAMSYGLRNKHYSVLYINHPDNPRPTIYSAYRDYGRFGAYFEKELKKGETLELKYCIWVAEGPMPEREELDNKYQEFTSRR